jgi:hypothetical protein
MKCFGEWAYGAAKLPHRPIRLKKTMQNLEIAPPGKAVTFHFDLSSFGY